MTETKPTYLVRSIPLDCRAAAAAVNCDVCELAGRRRPPVWIVDLPGDSELSHQVGNVAVLCDEDLAELTAEVVEAGRC